jgi:hypothetical protein
MSVGRGETVFGLIAGFGRTCGVDDSANVRAAFTGGLRHGDG